MEARRTRKLAAVALAVLIALVVAMVRERLFSTIFLVAATAVGCAAYLLISRERVPPSADLHGLMTPATRRHTKLLFTSFFFFVCGVGLLVANSQVDAKPFLFYVLMSIAAALIAMRIGLLDRKGEVRMTLVMILFLALNLFGSDQLSFPNGIGGADSSTHLRDLVVPILQTGYIPATSPCQYVYGSAPDHHILVAAGSLLLGVGPANAYYLLGFIVMTIPVLVTFVVSRTLFGVRTGLLAALLLSGCSYYIYWASHASTLTFAIPLIAVLVLLLLMLLDRMDLRLLFLSSIFLLGLLLTHPYSAVIFAAILVAIIVGEAVKAGRGHPTVWGARIVGGIFGYTLVVHWTYDSCLVTRSESILASYLRAFTQEAFLAPPAVYDTLPVSTIFVNTLGDAFLLVLLTIGLFLLISRGLSTRQMIVLAPAIGLLVLTSIGLLTKLAYLLPNRIYVFLQFLAIAPLGAVAFRYTWRQLQARRGNASPAAHLLLVGIVVAGFTFASAASTVAGFETSPFVLRQPYVKLYNTQYEGSAAAWACQNFGDHAYVELSRSMIGLSRSVLKDCTEANGGVLVSLPISPFREVDVGALKGGSFVVFSRYDLSPGYPAGIASVGRFGQGIIEQLLADAPNRLASMDRLYDNGPVQVFLVPG